MFLFFKSNVNLDLIYYIHLDRYIVGEGIELGRISDDSGNSSTRSEESVQEDVSREEAESRTKEAAMVVEQKKTQDTSAPEYAFNVRILVKRGATEKQIVKAFKSKSKIKTLNFKRLNLKIKVRFD